MNLYEVLGVNKDAILSQLKKAYRKKAKKLHPDAGGNPQDFKALVVAYNILSDPDKRERYDKGESIDEIHKKERSENEMICEVIISLFMGIMNSSRDIKKTHIPKEIQRAIAHNMSEIGNQIQQKREGITKFEVVKKRFSTTSGENVFEKVCSSQIANLQSHIERLEKQLEVGEKAKVFLDAYSYEIDPEVMEITFQQLYQQANDLFR